MPTRIVVGICAFAAALSLIFCWGFAGQNSAPLVAFAVLWGLTGLSFTSLWSKLITIVSGASLAVYPETLLLILTGNLICSFIIRR